MSIARLQRALRASVPPLGAWPIRALSRPLMAYVLAVPTAALVAIGVTASQTKFQVTDLALFLALLACGAIAVEARRKVEEPQGTRARDVFSVWCLPVAIFLPPVYALLAPLPLTALAQWRVQRGVVYRRFFSAAATSLGFGAASTVFHSLPDWLAGPEPGTGVDAVTWGVAVVACGMVRWAVNNALIVIAVRSSDPEVRVLELLGGRENAYNELVELSLSFLVTVAVGAHPVLVVFAVPTVLLQQRFLLHAQLVTEARIDAKTGLLNAHAWEREATTEISRTARTGEPLAVLLLDIDHFKSVNDGYGHLVGDRVLRTVADALRRQLRPYDLVGRIGGEEFAILLPVTDIEAAMHTAERVRSGVAELAVPYDGAEGHSPVHVTVSVGLTGQREEACELTDLLAAADLALYRAKDAGRNRIEVLTAAGSRPEE